MSDAAVLAVDEHLDGGLRYSEEVSTEAWRGPCRRCRLWAPGGNGPVSSLVLWTLKQRFGAVVLEIEGMGGVETPPDHRGKGYGTRLVTRALAGAAGRVDAVFLYGIRRMYSKLGFATCLADSSLSVRVRDAERAGDSPPADRGPLGPGDLPALVRLFNTEHRTRPWTLVREDSLAKRLAASHPWRPAPETIVIRSRGELRGYAIVSGTTYGKPLSEFTAIEMTAADPGSARSLLAAVAAACFQWRIDTFTVEEPPDGMIGTEARRLGCEERRIWVPDGEGMGRILRRSSLLARLEGELARRERCAETGEVIASAEGLSLAGAGSARTFEALRSGELVPDDGQLLQLILGYRSWQEAERSGLEASAEHRRTLARWFPGAAPYLPVGHAHRLDRY